MIYRATGLKTIEVQGLNEMEQLSYNDVMADLASVVEQYGALRFLADFHNNYPKHFAEISSQIDRETHHGKVPRLLMKPDDASTM